MSSSDFNKLLAEKHEGGMYSYHINQIFDEYIKLHLPDERIMGEPTNRLADGVQLGAIYIVKYDDWDELKHEDEGYWFVAGYTERWGLELFWGETIEGRITRESLNVWKGLNRYSPNQDNIITDFDALVRIWRYFIGGANEDKAEIFIAYSPYPYSPYPTISRTLNFSRRGFL